MFAGKQLFIREQNSLPVQRCDATKETSTFLQSYTLVVSRTKLNPLKLVRLELKLLSGYLADLFERDAGFTGNFFHRHCRISLDAFFDEVAVTSGGNCALSVASRTVTGMAELL